MKILLRDRNGNVNFVETGSLGEPEIWKKLEQSKKQNFFYDSEQIPIPFYTERNFKRTSYYYKDVRVYQEDKPQREEKQMNDSAKEAHIEQLNEDLKNHMLKLNDMDLQLFGNPIIGFHATACAEDDTEWWGKIEIGKPIDYVFIPEPKTENATFIKLCQRIFDDPDPSLELWVGHGEEETGPNEYCWTIEVPAVIADALTPDTAPELERRLRRAYAILEGKE